MLTATCEMSFSQAQYVATDTPRSAATCRCVLPFLARNSLRLKVVGIVAVVMVHSPPCVVVLSLYMKIIHVSIGNLNLFRYFVDFVKVNLIYFQTEVTI